MNIADRVNLFLGPKEERAKVQSMTLLQAELDRLQRPTSAVSGVPGPSRGALELLETWLRKGYVELVEMLTRKQLPDATSDAYLYERMVVLRATVLVHLGQNYQAVELLGSLGKQSGRGLLSSILAAVATFNDGDHSAATDRLFQIYAHMTSNTTNNQLNPNPNPNIRLVVYLLVGFLHHENDRVKALQICEEFFGREGSDVEGLLVLGKLHLQLGNVVEARRVHERIVGLWVGAYGEQCGDVAVLEGLVLFAEGAFRSAFQRFETVVVEAMKDPSQLERRFYRADKELHNILLCAHRAPIYIQALNNLAVCALHCFQLDRAVELLEGAIRSRPYQSINDVVVTNLSTLYDLTKCPPASELAKRVILETARHYGIANRLKARDLRMADQASRSP